MKVCSKCKELKDESEFHKQGDTKSGLRSNCKKCRKGKTLDQIANKRKYDIEYLKKNKNKRQKYLLVNKEKIRRQRKEYRKQNRKELKKYYKINREKILIQRKNYREENKFLIASQKKEYYKNNIEQQKKYREKNKERLTKQHKEWREKNKEELIKKAKEYCKKNKERITKRTKKYIRNRSKTDINFKLSYTLRNRIRQAIKRNSKSAPTKELLGCTIEYARSYLEAQFQDGMNWKNHGLWHIDHILPCASFDLSDPEQQRKCFHYTNLQPLWAKDNLSKGSKIMANKG